MSYPTILPSVTTEASGTPTRTFEAVVNSVFLRALTAVALIAIAARLGATVTGVGDLA